uniref:30S ribosomal protein S6-like n=1 Tax=Nelumbo nucifera TaxID=4432 RepID=A0A822Y408_NELNU|nr:TPA_asm: hypothetical protein HUJ06_028201 [Nelumbo nucifera]
MQMTMMVTPNFNKELHYLNKEDRLLRWLLVKHRDVKFGLDLMNEDGGKDDLGRFQRSSLFGDEDIDKDDNDDDDEEYEVEESKEQEKC